MYIACQFYSCPKYGKTANEYQDAFKHSLVSRVSSRFAIADGVTDSIYQKMWADALVEYFVDQGFPAQPSKTAITNDDIVNKWLAPIKQKWHASIDWVKLEKKPMRKAKTEKVGALATFLGFEIVKVKNGSSQPRYSWRAYSCGDANLFVVRNNKLIKSFPIITSLEFNDTPKSLCSLQRPDESISTSMGLIKTNDTFILCTDAMAKWFLIQHEKGDWPWNTLSLINNKRQFNNFIRELRTKDEIEDDDNTLAIVNIIWFDNRKTNRRK